MNVNELRPGNIIFLIKDSGKKEYELTGFDIYKLDESDCADIEPVPITAEHLEKFGFEFYWMSCMCLIQLKVVDKLRIVRSYSHDISGDLELDLRYDCLCTNIPRIKYIHELQNIYYALTQNELIQKPCPTTTK